MEIIQKSEFPLGRTFETRTWSIYWHIYVYDIRMEAAAEKRWSVTVSDLNSGMDLYTGLPAARYARETLLFLSFLFLFSSTTVFSVGPHAVCPFGMADWLDRLRACIIYTVFLIKKKKCKKSSVASAASSVALHGLPLRSRSLRAEDRIQNHE